MYSARLRGLKLISASLVLLSCASVMAQHEEISLWSKGAPGSEGKTGPEIVKTNEQGEHIVSHVNDPSITIYLPSTATAPSAGVLVIPGGGHSELWMDHEGYSVATWLSSHGVAAFVLKYRLAREKGSTYTIEGTELQDAQRALRILRSRAAEWHVDPARIGVIGFSAGGELAALVSTRSDAGRQDAVDPIDRQSSVPAFQGLMYPSIPRDMPLSKLTPPAFLACGADDRVQVSQGLPELYVAMKRAGVLAELHVFSSVGHGFGIRTTNDAGVSQWPNLFLDWLASSGFIGHSK